MADDGCSRDFQKETLELIHHLAELTERRNERLDILVKEVKDLRDTRHRPYLTTMGAMLALIMGVTSYVYNLEMRLSNTVSDDRARIVYLERDSQQHREHLIEMENRIAHRLMMRTKNVDRRWIVHSSQHRAISENFCGLSGGAMCSSPENQSFDRLIERQLENE